MTTTDQARPSQGVWPLAAAFFLPVLLLGTAFALHGIFPFGDQQILVTDFWQQYYPFFSDLWHKLREGNSLLWSWTSGGGNYLSVIAYYLASPLNLLLALVPHAFLREALTAMLLVKLGTAGLCFALLLRYVFGRRDFTLAAFAMPYALCAFSLGYYWNIIWFDAFALLPLVMLGLAAQLREGKFRLYMAALALAVLTNYYMGLFICIAVALTFFGWCMVRKPSGREFLERLGRIALTSVLALGFTAVLTLPAVLNLSGTYKPTWGFPKTGFFYEKFTDIIGNFAAFAAPTDKVGLPNVYCGLLCVMLLPVYLRARTKKVPVREKVVVLAALVLLVISCNHNMLNYIWHGFRYTNMLPYRFSFLISFLLAFVAYRAYTQLADLDFVDLIAMALFGGIVITCAALGPQSDTAVKGSLVLAGIYVVLFLLYERKVIKQGLLGLLLLVVIAAELGGSAWVGVETVRTTDREAYPHNYEAIQELLDQREDPDGPLYRTERSAWYTINDSSLYGYNGMSLFSSTVSEDLVLFVEGLGLPAWDAGNRYYYAETSPLTAAFLGIRYMIAPNTVLNNNGAGWNTVAEAGGAALVENLRPLPMGFMAREGLAGYAHGSGDPFADQNELFRLSTGLEAPIFHRVEATGRIYTNFSVTEGGYGRYSYAIQDQERAGTLRWDYMLDQDGLYYAYVDTGSDQDIQVIRNDDTWMSTVNGQRPYVFCLGNYWQGDTASIQVEVPAGEQSYDARVYVVRFDPVAFDEGYALLADEPLELVPQSDSRLTGSVEAREDGLLYTSIPYEAGWRAYVDGSEADIVTVDGCMLAVPLTAGTHQLEFRYRPAGFLPGVLVTAVSLAGFVALIALERRKKKQSDG